VDGFGCCRRVGPGARTARYRQCCTPRRAGRHGLASLRPYIQRRPLQSTEPNQFRHCRSARAAWSLDLEVTSSITAPLAVNGVVYLGAGHGVIHAVDARTGKLLWRYDPKAMEVNGKKLRVAKAKQGEHEYARCTLCHGMGVVAGGIAPDLRASPVLLSPEAFAHVVRDGALSPRGMPRFAELSNAQLEALIHFVRRTARNDLAAARAKSATH
jgi:hypothetical protein